MAENEAAVEEIELDDDRVEAIRAAHPPLAKET